MLTIVEPGWKLYTPTSMADLIPFIEKCGRCCYKSEDKITEDSADKFVRRICRNNHESVLEHASITVKITCSRAASHQLVRHRVGCAYSQESMRYCNYGKKGFQVICPPGVGLYPGRYEKTPENWYQYGNDGTFCIIKHPIRVGWLNTRASDICQYEFELKEGVPPEDARFNLPIATKTEIMTTFNIRMWRHVFKERGLNKHAQWEIRGIFKSILDNFAQEMPAFFKDLLDG